MCSCQGFRLHIGSIGMYYNTQFYQTSFASTDSLSQTHCLSLTLLNADCQCRGLLEQQSCLNLTLLVANALMRTVNRL